MRKMIFFSLLIVMFGLNRPVSAGGKIDDGQYWIYNGRGIIMALLNHSELKRDGLSLYFYDNGAMRREEMYNKGKMEGTARSYYEDIKMAAKEKFKDNQRQGVTEKFYPSGKLWVELTYDQNEPHGISVVFSQRGVPQQAVKFDHGIILGVRYFDEKGNLSQESKQD